MSDKTLIRTFVAETLRKHKDKSGTMCDLCEFKSFQNWVPKYLTREIDLTEFKEIAASVGYVLLDVCPELTPFEEAKIAFRRTAQIMDLTRHTREKVTDILMLASQMMNPKVTREEATRAVSEVADELGLTFEGDPKPFDPNEVVNLTPEGMKVVEETEQAKAFINNLPIPPILKNILTGKPTKTETMEVRLTEDQEQRLKAFIRDLEKENKGK